MTHRGSATETASENDKAYDLEGGKTVNGALPAGDQNSNDGLVASPSQC